MTVQSGKLLQSLGLVVILGLLATPAAAQTGPITTQSLFFNNASNAHQGNYLEAEAGLIYSDNIDLTPGGSGDGLAMVGLVGNTERANAPRFDYHLDSDITVVKYFKNEFQTQPYGYLDADGTFKIVPGTFNWTARETFTQASLDPAAPPTPDNLESINYISTGPQLILRPTLRTTITLDGTYSYVYSSSKSPEYVDIDNHRLGGDLRIERAFSSLLSTYVTGSYSKVEFVNTIENTDFSYAQGAGGFRFGDARTVLDASIGYTEVHPESTPVTYPTPHGALAPMLFPDEFEAFPDATAVLPAATATATTTTTTPPQAQNFSGVNWQVNLSRVISATQRVSLHAISQISDAANLFRLNLDQPVPANQVVQLASGQPFTYKEYGGSWRFDNGRTSLQLAVLSFTSDYEQTPESNRDTKQVSAVFARQINLDFNLDVGFTYEHDAYPLTESQHTFNAFTSLRWRLGPKLGLRFVLAHSSQSPNGYTQNQVGVIASYALTRGAEKADALMKPTSGVSQPYLP